MFSKKLPMVQAIRFLSPNLGKVNVLPILTVALELTAIGHKPASAKSIVGGKHAVYLIPPINV